MSHPKTHQLRAKPPWREGLDHSMCGRRAEDCASIVPPDDEMAARARTWSRARYSAPKYPPVPDGLCSVCYERLGTYGFERWQADPVKVLHIDTVVVDRRGRDALRTELLALASLAAEYPDRFRELLEGESVMQALAGLMR